MPFLCLLHNFFVSSDGVRPMLFSLIFSRCSGVRKSLPLFCSLSSCFLSSDTVLLQFAKYCASVCFFPFLCSLHSFFVSSETILPELPSPPSVRLQSVPASRSILPYLAISSISSFKASSSEMSSLTFSIIGSRPSSFILINLRSRIGL